MTVDRARRIVLVGDRDDRRCRRPTTSAFVHTRTRPSVADRGRAVRGLASAIANVWLVPLRIVGDDLRLARRGRAPRSAARRVGSGPRATLTPADLLDPVDDLVGPDVDAALGAVVVVVVVAARGHAGEERCRSRSPGRAGRPSRRGRCRCPCRRRRARPPAARPRCSPALSVQSASVIVVIASCSSLVNWLRVAIDRAVADDRHRRAVLDVEPRPAGRDRARREPRGVGEHEHAEVVRAQRVRVLERLGHRDDLAVDLAGERARCRSRTLSQAAVDAVAGGQHDVRGDQRPGADLHRRSGRRPRRRRATCRAAHRCRRSPARRPGRRATRRSPAVLGVGEGGRDQGEQGCENGAHAPGLSHEPGPMPHGDLGSRSQASRPPVAGVHLARRPALSSRDVSLAARPGPRRLQRIRATPDRAGGGPRRPPIRTAPIARRSPPRSSRSSTPSCSAASSSGSTTPASSRSTASARAPAASRRRARRCSRSAR